MQGIGNLFAKQTDEGKRKFLPNRGETEGDSVT